MAENFGQILQFLETDQISCMYKAIIRKLQPVELLRRLENYKVSTRGHMSELRGRLLRFEARKLYPEIDVPWYPEDDEIQQFVVEKKKKVPSIVPFPGKSSEEAIKPSYALEASGKKCIEEKTNGAESAQEEELYSVKMARAFEDFEERKRLALKNVIDISSIKNPEVKRDAERLEEKIPGIVQNWELIKVLLEKQTSRVSEKSSTQSKQEKGIISSKPTPSSAAVNKHNHTSVKPNLKFSEFTMVHPRDDDPFEHVDSSDWMDDYIE